MKISIFRIVLTLLYLIGFATFAWALYTGWDYFQSGLGDRPYHPLHAVLKPGGLWGHGFGVIGSAMVLLLFLYSARKREYWGLRQGPLSRWLDIHIWLGITGPLLITLHTAGKFGGIVSISYYSMLSVVISGFFGRYIYMQIPRDDRGMELTLEEIETRIEALGSLLHDDYHVPDKVLDLLRSHSGGISGSRLAGTKAVASLLLFDLLKPFRSIRLRRHLNKYFPDFPRAAQAEILKLARQRATFARRRALLGSINSVFHYWHVFHKPFAVVMIVIMFLHIAVVTLLGYRWIF